jgi:hypothetical protein
LWIFAVMAAAGAAAAEEPSRLCGRVLERGASTIVRDAVLTAGEGEPQPIGDDGRFCLDLGAGEVDVAVTADGYQPLHVKESLAAGTRRTVEYRLVPLVGHARFRSKVRGNGPHEGEHFMLRDEELKQAPGTGGDPFRVIGLLPGVLAPIPILPIYVVRGGSPGMNGFFLDGMRVPQLFHLLVTEGVVHPEIVDHLEFYPGGFDATFGRVGSGVVDASTRPARTDAPAHGTFEVRLYDTSALVEAKLPGGVSLLAAGRYGYPGLLVSALVKGVSLSYWDYQLRLDWKGLTVEALGSYDSLSIDPSTTGGPGGGTPPNLLTEFHRIQIREQLHRGRFDLEAAVVGGLDRMALFSASGVQKLALSARVNARARVWWLTLAAGAETELSRFTTDAFTTDDNRTAPDALGDLAGVRFGVVGGGYAQASLSLERLLHRPASITVGVRADAYHAGDVTLLGIDPRVLARYAPLKQLELFAAFGQYSQAPSFPIPLPGIDTFALQLGLQRSVQGSFGFRLQLPWDLSAQLTGYYGKFTNINDVLLDFEAAACTSPPPEGLKGIASYTTRQLDGAGYGMEALVRRQHGRVTGWISYTLSRSERVYSCGLAPSDFDQSHVLNAVVQVRLPWRLMLGFHLNLQTGRPYTLASAEVTNGMVNISGHRNDARLPTYFQLDVRLDREWLFKRWALSLFVEILNLAYSETIFGVTYPKDPTMMVTLYNQPQFQGFRWILPSFGLRARF